MIECKVEETKLDIDKAIEEHQKIVDEILEIQGIEHIEAEAEYPKTYEECCYVLGFENTEMVFEDDYRDINPPKEQWKRLGLMNQLNKLLICRDAYWHIYGEEMGLGKPWEPDWDAKDNHFYTIHTFNGKIECSAAAHRNSILIFPTEEMRSEFYENFKNEIEICKELL